MFQQLLLLATLGAALLGAATAAAPGFLQEVSNSGAGAICDSV